MATHSNILAWRIPWTEEPFRYLVYVFWSSIFSAFNTSTNKNDEIFKTQKSKRCEEFTYSINISCKDSLASNCLDSFVLQT